MKALLCTSPGPASNLRISDAPRPSPGAGEVLIEVASSGLNFLDTLIIEGRYQVKPKLPFSPGAELSRRIAALGEGVGEGDEGLKPGDRVMAFPGYGALAEFATAAAHQVVRVPDAMDDNLAAALPIGHGTAIHALKDRANLRAGESVLILGAAGGVGLAAVECAHAMGAHVIAAASSEDKLALAKAHGAADMIDYSSEDLRGRLREIVGPDGVDVVFDPVGGKLTEPAFRSTAWAGRFLVIGFAAGDIPSIPLNLPLVKGSAIVGVFWGSFASRNPEANAENLSLIADWVLTGKIRPHLGAIRPFSQAADAIADLAARKALGKTVIRVAADTSGADT